MPRSTRSGTMYSWSGSAGVGMSLVTLTRENMPMPADPEYRVPRGMKACHPYPILHDPQLREVL